MRSVSARRASIASAGWQQVKISRSRSSSMAPRGSGGPSSYTVCASLCLSSRLLSRRIRSMALRLAVVVSQAPGLGYAVGGPPLDGGRERFGAASSAMSRSPNRLVRPATTRAHSSWWTRVIASRTSTMVTPGTAGPRPCGCRPSTPPQRARAPHRGRGPRRSRSRRGTPWTPEGPVGDHRLPTPAVDDGGRVGRGEAAGEDPVALGPEPVVEHVDRRVLVGGGEGRLVVDHGNQVLHLRIISCGVKTVRVPVGDVTPLRTAGTRPAGGPGSSRPSGRRATRPDRCHDRGSPPWAPPRVGGLTATTNTTIAIRHPRTF